MNTSCAASQFLPELNGDSMGPKDPNPQPTVTITLRTFSPVKFRRCSNTSGHGSRCKREALPNRKRCQNCTRSNFYSLKRNWATRMVLHSKRSDKYKKYKWEPAEYVNKQWILTMFRKTGATCYWCGATNLNIKRRTGADGLTLERLSNKLPHLKRNCVLACGQCNRQSWRENFKLPPYHLLRYRYSLSPVTRDTMITQERLCLEIRASNQPKPYRVPCVPHLGE